jgi:hypothetical protein
MPTARPFAYNTGSPIGGTNQIGYLAIGTPTSGFTNNPQFWNGPDEELGYVIAHPVSGGTQPNPLSIPAYVGFWRSTALTDGSFINLAEYVSVYNGTPQTFTGGTQAKTWLNSNGYWTSYGEGGGGTTGDYVLLAQYSPATINGSITFPNHNAPPNFSLNPNLVGQVGYAIYINGNDLLGNSQTSVLDNLLGRNGTLTLTQGVNLVVYSFTSTAFGFGGGYANQYWWDNQFNASPLGTITVVTPASGDFNDTDPITITVS